MSNPGFFGKNGLQPFIGQIPLAQTINKTSLDGWGDRYKVRIQGYDPESGTTLSDDDLDWGIVIKPSSQGSGNKGTVGFTGGETVFGMWDPNSNPRIIFILGSIGRNNYTVERSATEQAQLSSLGFKLPNIFIDGHNPAQGWNYKSGANGTPPGQQTPYSPTQTAFTQGLNLLGG